MGLSCSCDDFDKSDHDNWWEPGRRSVPPPGTKCCECCAPLPDEPLTCVIHMEVYDPGDDIEPEPRDFTPPHPVTSNSLGMIAEHCEEMHEDAMEDYRDRYGWDDECERFERVASKDYRCERCEGLVAAIEDLGYCMIAPGDLVDNHVEYVAEHGQHEIGWRPGRDGVWHPRRLTRLDFAKREARRRWRNAVYIVLQGGWKHKLRGAWIRSRGFVERKTMPRLGYVYRYDHEAKRHRWTHADKREVA